MDDADNLAHLPSGARYVWSSYKSMLRGGLSGTAAQVHSVGCGSRFQVFVLGFLLHDTLTRGLVYQNVPSHSKEEEGCCCDIQVKYHQYHTQHT